MRKVIILLGVIMCVTILVILYQIVSNHPLSKDTVRDIFGEDVECRLRSKHDLGGYTLHGDMFVLYEYDVSMKQLAPLISQNKLKNYPAFEAGEFENLSLADSNFAIKWKHMPLQTRIDSLIYQSTFSFWKSSL